MGGRLGLRGFLAVTGLAVLLYAGSFKGSPLLAKLPIDLTVLGVAMTGVGLLAVLGSPSGLQRFRPALPSLALSVLFLLGVYQYVGSSYGTSKWHRFFTITAVATVGAAVLLVGQRRRRAWLGAQITVGALLAVSALISPATQYQYEVGRYALALEGSTTLALGRDAGAAVVGCMVLSLFGRTIERRRRWWLGLLGVALIYPLLDSGSRGPTAAAVLAVIVVALLAPGVALDRAARVALTVAAVAIGYITLRSDVTGGVGRVTSTLFSGNFSDTSSLARAQLWSDAWGYVEKHPFGGGWGLFSTPQSSFQLLGTNGLNYPHDVLLEVAGEAGWIAVVGVMIFIGGGLRRLRNLADDPCEAALFGIAIFFVINALVSGDINDNRLMWASLALAWGPALGRRFGRRSLATARRDSARQTVVTPSSSQPVLGARR